MSAALIACHECDLLQREVALPPGGTARCARCAGVLYRNPPDSLNRSAAYALAAAILFGVANAFPIVGLQVQGELVHTTLIGASGALYGGGMKTLGAVVFITTVLAPLIELTAILALLLPLKLGRAPRGRVVLFRLMRIVQPWRMAEVLVLGVLVALVKLAHMAKVVPGVALWSLGALVVLMATCISTLDMRAVWAAIERSR